MLTPHLQALADRGTVFERSYCNAPLCAPSRASHADRAPLRRLPVNDNAEELPASAVTFVHHLRRAGYRTVLSGKMHYVGPDQLHGFEERLTTDIYPADFMWTKTWDSQGDPPRRVGLPGDAETGASYVRQMAQMVKEAGPVPWSYQHDYDEETHHRALATLRDAWPGAQRARHGPRQRLVPLRLLHPPPRPLRQPARSTGTATRGGRSRPRQPPPPGWRPHPIDVWTNTYHGVDAVAPTAEDVARARRGYYASTSYFDDKLGALLGELDRLGLADEHGGPGHRRPRGHVRRAGDVVQAHRAGVGGAGAPDRRRGRGSRGAAGG